MPILKRKQRFQGKDTALLSSIRLSPCLLSQQLQLSATWLKIPNRTWCLVFFWALLALIIQLHKVQYSTNKVLIEKKISCDIVRLFGKLVILYCKKSLFNQSVARATLLYPLCFSRPVRNEQKDSAEKKSSWIKCKQRVKKYLAILHTKTSNETFYLMAAKALCSVLQCCRHKE